MNNVTTNTILDRYHIRNHSIKRIDQQSLIPILQLMESFDDSNCLTCAKKLTQIEVQLEQKVKVRIDVNTRIIEIEGS